MKARATKFTALIYFMPLDPRPTSRQQHHIVVSLTPRWLRVIHFRRSIWGWQRAHEGSVRLGGNPENLDEIHDELGRITASWGLNGRRKVDWVVSGDILGIAAPQSAESLQSELPFTLTETVTAREYLSPQDRMTFLWMHKDWLAELERISASRGWELVEIFSRAQLFQREMAFNKRISTAILEHEDDCLLFHMYQSGGGITRSTVIEESNPEHALLRFNAEFRSLTTVQGVSGQRPRILISEDFQIPGDLYEIDRLKKISEFDRLESLWRSNAEGIVVRSSLAEHVKRLKFFTAAIAALGLAGVSFVAWHDSYLEETLASDLRQERILAPKAVSAKNMVSRTVEMSSVMEAMRRLQDSPDAFVTFQWILASFPPPPAALLHVNITPRSIEIFGTGLKEHVEWVKKRPIAGHTEFSEIQIPDFLASRTPEIHLAATRNDTKSIAPVLPGEVNNP